MAAPVQPKTWTFAFPGLETIQPAKGNSPCLRLGFSSREAEEAFVDQANFNEMGRREGLFAGPESEGTKHFTYFYSTDRDASYYTMLDVLSSAVRSDASIPALRISAAQIAAQEPFIPFDFRRRSQIDQLISSIYK